MISQTTSATTMKLDNLARVEEQIMYLPVFQKRFKKDRLLEFYPLIVKEFSLVLFCLI